MVLYLSIIFGALFVLGLCDCVFATKVFEVSGWTFILAILVSLVAIILIDALFAFVVSKLPNKWFSMNNKAFHVSKGEQKFYEHLGIRKWKDKVWELGGLGGFSKSKIDKPNDPKYIERFIIESNKGVFEHICGIVCGFLIILIYPKFIWVVGFPIAMVNLLLNTMSTMILKYNTPKLHVLHKRLTRNQENEMQKEETQENKA